jgi:hypothetical protein
MGQDLWQKQGSGKLNIVGQHALHLGRVFCIYEHSDNRRLNCNLTELNLNRRQILILPPINRQYVMTSGFVGSWIYLYTTDWKNQVVTGITAYKRRSSNEL